MVATKFWAVVVQMLPCDGASLVPKFPFSPLESFCHFKREVQYCESLTILNGPESPGIKSHSKRNPKTLLSGFLWSEICYTGVDQITTKYAGGSTHCQDNMLPRGRCFPRINPSSAHLFLQDEAHRLSLARSVFLSPCSRVNRCDAYSI